MGAVHNFKPGDRVTDAHGHGLSGVVLSTFEGRRSGTRWTIVRLDRTGIETVCKARRLRPA